MAEKTYTVEQTVALVEQYKAGTSTEELALAFGKSVRSIVAKLAREGVYKKKEAVTEGKSGATRKDELVLQLELFSGVELKSLQKATREDLEKLIAFIKREG